MGENELPVLLAKTCHHESEHVEECSEEQEISRTVVVEEKTDDGPRQEHYEYLTGRNPSYGRGRVLAELVCLVIALEDTDAVQPSKRAEKTAE